MKQSRVKVALTVSILMNLILVGYGLFYLSKTKEIIQPGDVQYAQLDSSKNAIQKEYEDAVLRIDALTSLNDSLYRKYVSRQRVKINDHLVDMAALKKEDAAKVDELFDYVIASKDSIDLILNYVSDELESDEDLAFKNTRELNNLINQLGIIKTHLDLELDASRLSFLRKERSMLDETMTGFDNKKAKLSILTVRIKKFSTYFGKAIDALALAVKLGIVVG